MIKQITDFTYKSFLHYTNPDNLLFKQKNVIFGYNGKGKSSLAKGLENEIKKEKNFEEANLRFFSRDVSLVKLIDDNTKRIKGIKAIFGNENINNDNEIERLENDLVNLEEMNNNIQDIYSKIDNAIRITEDNIRGRIKIRHINFSDYQNANELREFLNSNYVKALKITTDEKLDSFTGSFDFEKVERDIRSLPTLELAFNSADISNAIMIMNKLYSPDKIPSQELLDWIKNGLILNKNEERCLFCGSPIINIEDIEFKYKEYLSNEKQKDTKKIIDLLKNLSSTKQLIEDFLTHANLYQFQNIDISDELEKIQVENEKLEKFINQLKVKLDNFEAKIDVDYDLASFATTLMDESENIKQIKRDAENKISSEQKRVNDLIKGLIAKRLLNNNSLKVDLDGYDKAIEQLLRAKNNNKNIKNRIEELRSSSSAYASFAQYINGILLDLEIKFKLEIIDNEYRILPLNEDVEIRFEEISEGERNLLSFLFFYYELFDDLNKLSFKTDLRHIIVDDPIASLDENNRTYLVSLLRTLLDKKNQFQTFILTHDWTCFCNLVYGYKNDLMCAIEVKKDKDSHSFLALAKATISPYEHDFFELIDIVEEKKSPDALDDSDIYHLPNCMRRVLENFLIFKTENHSPTDNNFEEIKKVFYTNEECSVKKELSLHTLLTLINANSHLPARNADDIYTSLKYLVNVISKADPIHFNMIKSKRGAYNKLNDNRF